MRPEITTAINYLYTELLNFITPVEKGAECKMFLTALDAAYEVLFAGVVSKTEEV